MAARLSPVRLVLAGLIAANLVGWIWAFGSFAGRPALIGTALLAWVFGLRHAVDADHIAAIDNVVRAQMAETPRGRTGPQLVGLWFSLGHSTIVVLASAAVALAVSTMQDRLEAAKAFFGIVGTGVSSAFLLVIALANLAILRGVWRQFRQVRAGGAIEHGALPGGPLARLFGPVLRAVRKPWHMYPVGFLFGLGFDTATEVGLLGIAATQAAQGLPAWQVLVFPALFTAGMALVDTADSVLMVGAYGWAYERPLRKLWYNLTITAASVIVALLIGGIEALGLIGERLGLEGGVWHVVAMLNDDLAYFGFVVVAIFALCWAVSAFIYRRMGYDQLAERA